MDQLQPIHQTLLTREEFRRLADVPPEAEWFGNLRNPHTRRALNYYCACYFHDFL